MDKGWICLHRQIRDCDLLWNDKPYSRGQAWIDLLLMANHETKKMLFDGNVVEVKRGQRITSIRKLCDSWGWSNSKVAKFLNLLEMEQMIVKKSDTKKTLITIVNYDKFQDIDEKKRHKNDTETPQKRTNNNDNNDNNDNNINPPLSPTGGNETSEHDFTKNTNLENTQFILRNHYFEDWEYIQNQPELWDVIKSWMKYRDSKTPKKKYHYDTEMGIIKLLGKFVKSNKEYGIEEVRRVTDDAISAEYQGVLWDKLTKPKSNGTNWGQIK